MYLIIAGIGLVLLLIALLFDDVFDGLLPDNEFLSLPSIAAGMVAFGSTAWLLEQAGLPIATVIGGGALVSVVCAYLAYRLSRAAIDMHTDGTPTHDDLLGNAGRVVTAIAAASTGEVLVNLAGQPVKLTASAANGEFIPTGDNIIVVSVESPTRVTVQAADTFWSETRSS